MRVGILGSWKKDFGDWRLRSAETLFATACRELGRHLAESNVSVIVGGSSKPTADANVVEGILEVAKNLRPESPLIEVLRPRRGETPYHDLSNRYPHLFHFHSAAFDDWTTTHLLTVRESDCVVAIGGNEGTYNGGLAAFIAKKPLAPIGSFGAAAERLLHDSALWAPHVSRDEYVGLSSPWSSVVLSRASQVLGIGRKPRIMLVHGRSADRHELANWLNSRPNLCELRVMQDEFSAGHLLPQKLEQLASWADGAIVLATPDDVGALAGNDPSPRARENVWIEVGWFWGRLGRQRILLLRKNDVEIPSDLQGVMHSRYELSPSESSEDIRTFLGKVRD